MGKSGAAAFFLMRLFQQNPGLWDYLLTFIVWLLVATLDTAIISALIALIIKSFNKNTTFYDIFRGIFIIVGIIHIILTLIMLFA